MTEAADYDWRKGEWSFIANPGLGWSDQKLSAAPLSVARRYLRVTDKVWKTLIEDGRVKVVTGHNGKRLYDVSKPRLRLHELGRELIKGEATAAS